MGKFYTDRQRFDFVKGLRASGETVSVFARKHGLARATLRDWAYAYSNMEGSFINVTAALNGESSLIGKGQIRANAITPEEALRKSTHFSRFDHSLVVIEIGDIKVTTSLSQAETLLRDYYDRSR